MLRSKIDAKIPDITNLATNTTFITKIDKVKGELTIITNLATATTPTAAENKIPNISSLVQKIDYNKINSETEHEISMDGDKYIITQDFNKSTSEYFAGRLK